MSTMPYTFWLVVLSFLDSVSSIPTETQHSFQLAAPHAQLKGRFLHVTDMHPDPYYLENSSINKACHRPKKAKKKLNRAGYYGTPFAECDSPTRLTNYTLDFIDKHWAREIDFVVWTGDSARHDNDRQRPRDTQEIYDLNRAMVQKMDKIFTRRGIPVIPSLGNNDIWPHNIMTPGPNSITSEFSGFVPFPHRQVFQRGAYYSVEVVPDELAVISLNTMYFYDANKAVGGCMYSEPNDPGNLQFDWLEVQLTSFRSRDIKVWISGHIPPSSGNYFPECYVRYAELSLRFQDTILGHLYGHMNADHVSVQPRILNEGLILDEFFFVESLDLNIEVPDVRTKQQQDLFLALLQNFENLPKAKETNLDEFAVINVSPSVVPNPYLPSFRIFAYNMTAFSASTSSKKNKEKKKPSKRKPHHPPPNDQKDSLCKEEPWIDSWKCRLNNTWHSDPDAPSRRNGLWSPLGYAQYYIPDLAEGNKTHKPAFKLEYLTFHPSQLHPSDVDAWRPLPLKSLPKSLREGPVDQSKYLPYEMEDLTIGSWISLARRLADPGAKKLRTKFQNFMFMGEEA